MRSSKFHIKDEKSFLKKTYLFLEGGEGRERDTDAGEQH